MTQLVPKKPFAFTPFAMRTKLRFVEGYVGNATVRGWKDYDSIYHTVFADFRGSGGYPKGRAYDSVPEGLLLRPAIPSEGLNGAEGNGPKANFKIALRELPNDGRFRVTVTAARYNDGLLLDKGATPRLQADGCRHRHRRTARWRPSTGRCVSGGCLSAAGCALAGSGCVETRGRTGRRLEF